MSTASLSKTALSAADIIIQHEGGYVNAPTDAGGATNYGITQRTWDSYAREYEPSLNGTSVASMPLWAARNFWARQYVKYGLDDVDTRFIPLFSSGGLMGFGTALRLFRTYFVDKVLPVYPNLEAPPEMRAKGTGPLSPAEKQFLDESFGAAGVQFFANLLTILECLRWSRVDIEALKAGKPSPGSASLVYLLGWITRRFSPSYTSAIPFALKLSLARWALRKVHELRTLAGPELVEPRAGSGKKVVDLIAPRPSNWLWRDKELQRQVGY